MLIRMEAKKITQIREKLGLNQAELSQLLGVHQMTVSRWERGTMTPSPYLSAMLHEFATAADKKNQKNNEVLKNLLLTAGVIAAVFFLLKIAKEGK